MSLVGDLILGFRELATDLPQVYPPPNIVSAVASAGSLLGAGTYSVVMTFITQWGETAPSNEVFVTTTGPNGNITITYGGAGLNLSQILGVKIYFGSNSPGAESQFQLSTTSFGSPIILQFSQGVASPPTRNTAYLPDTDGNALSAYATYRWLNQALTWAAGKNRGGLPDFGAVGTTGGVGNYIMNGYWKKIDNGWYDGYPMGLLSKNNVFRRNSVTGYSGCLTIFQATDRLMIECWPQPSRTSGQTTLAAPMAATDTTATLTSSAGFVLGFGMVQIGTEIMYYSAISGNTLTGILRGMNGTVPAVQLTSAAVTELNLLISGYRVPSTYAVGQAQSILFLPPGWDEALVSYMIYRFRKAEQDENAAKIALGEATQKMSDLSANRIIAGPRQIQPYASQGPEIAVGLGSPFGGIIIP